MEAKEIAYIINIIVAICMAIITLYLIILYIKSESFHTYSCYYIIIMSAVILLDCLLQFIPTSFGGQGEYEGWEFLKDLVTIFFDKLILTISTMQIIVIYMAVIHSNYFISNERKVFIGGIVISLIISGGLAAIYSSIRWVTYPDGTTIYDEDEDDDKKGEESYKRTVARKVIEIIFCIVLFIANVFCLGVVLGHISKKRKEQKAGTSEDIIDYEKQLARFLVILFINVIAILVSGIIVNFHKPKDYDEIIYLVVCFAMDLCYSINKTLYRETLKLFKIRKFSNDNEEKMELKKISTFGEEFNDNNDDEDFV